MRVKTPVVLVTGKPEPKAWEYNGRSGVSYKVSISDGSSNVELPVVDAEIWNKFKSLGNFIVTIEISQVANDNRLSTRCRVVDAEEYQK